MVCDNMCSAMRLFLRNPYQKYFLVVSCAREGQYVANRRNLARVVTVWRMEANGVQLFQSYAHLFFWFNSMITDGCGNIYINIYDAFRLRQMTASNYIGHLSDTC